MYILTVEVVHSTRYHKFKADQPHPKEKPHWCVLNENLNHSQRPC